MKKLSWHTALLLNGSGNYKKAIKPTDLYKPIYDDEEQKKENLTKEEIQEKKELLREELLNSFNL